MTQATQAQEPEGDEIEELAKEIRRLIESNKQFLEKVNDEDFEDEEGAEGADSEPESGEDDYEEL